jgi:hypothetical protein
MVDMGYVRSENKLVIAGNALDVEMELEEAAMIPGMLVKIGTTVNEVLINDGVTLAYGWLGYEKSPIMYRPKDMDTAYAINARAAIMHGPGMTLRGLIGASNGGTIKSGDKLVGGAGGILVKWTPMVNTDAGDSNTEEHIEATAVEDSDDADKYLLVRSKI